MKKNGSRRIVALLLAVLMCVSLCACGSKAQETTKPDEYISEGEDVGPEVYTAPERTAVAFGEMSGAAFDQEAAEAALNQLQTLCTQQHTLKQIKENYDIVVNQFDCLTTDYSIAMIKYYQDMTDEEAAARYTELELLCTDFGDRVLTAIAAVLASPYREAMITYINDENVIEDADGYTAMDPELLELTEAESNLVQTYFTLSDSETAAPGDFEQLYLDLLDNRIAQLPYLDGDYETYADYCYAEVYSRDYSTEDLELFRQWVKEFAVPCLAVVANELNEQYADGLNAYYSLSLTQDQIIERVQPWVTSVSEEAAAAFRTMLDYDLVDIEASDVKVSAGFTTGLNGYGVPFIYIGPSGYGYDMEALIHEFGHYYEAVVNMEPQLYQYTCIDTAEVDSQGMEVLMFDYADEIYGDYVGDTAVLFTIYQLLNNIVSGCVFDEFQQEAFAARTDGSLTTPDQLTDIFLEIEESYYGANMWGEEWYLVNHTFESPFYYISYATSASAALSLLTVAEQDRDGAIAAYNELVTLGNEQGFVHTLEIVGLPNPLSEYGEAQMTEGLGDYFDTLCPDVFSPAA